MLFQQEKISIEKGVQGRLGTLILRVTREMPDDIRDDNATEGLSLLSRCCHKY